MIFPNWLHPGIAEMLRRRSNRLPAETGYIPDRSRLGKDVVVWQVLRSQTLNLLNESVRVEVPGGGNIKPIRVV